MHYPKEKIIMMDSSGLLYIIDEIRKITTEREILMMPEDYRPCYQWIVRQAILDILVKRMYAYAALKRQYGMPVAPLVHRAARIADHYRHDVYLCLYDHMREHVIQNVESLLLSYHVTLDFNDRIDVWVTYRHLFISVESV